MSAFIRKDDHRWYVYILCRPCGRPFYVGKGHGRRAFCLKRGRNDHFKNVINKYGEHAIKTTILFVKDEAVAFADEKRLIYYLKAIGCKLVNQTDGGEGCSGLKWSLESREKQKHNRLGKEPWNKGKSLPLLSKEHRAKISISVSGSRNGFYGKTHSAESKQKMSLSIKRSNRNYTSHVVSEEQKKKQSNAMKGRYAGCNNPFYGKTHTTETRLKISERRKSV